MINRTSLPFGYGVQLWFSNHLKPCRRVAQLLALLCLGLFSSQVASGQAPALLWRTNVAASLFAVDSQTNVYAGSNGTVIELSSDGVPVKTNVLSQLRGRPQRDAAGNFYFAGVRPGFDSGGIFQYGTTNSCFLAKFSSTGSLIWSNGFGPVGSLRQVRIDDLQIDTNGNIYAGFTWFVSTMSHLSEIARFDSSGSNIWTAQMPGGGGQNTIGVIRLGKISSTNGYVLTYTEPLINWALTVSRFDSNGTPTVITNWTSPYGPTPPLIQDSTENFYSVEGGGLTKRDPSGAVIWQNPTIPGSWPIGADFYGGVHVSDASDNLTRADSDGNLVWTTNFQTFSGVEMLLDPSGNRFITFSDSSIGRLGPESISSVSISSPPQPQTVFVGSNVTFSVGASGTTPLRYFWFFNNSFLSVQSNSSLTLPNVTTNQAGSYYVIVSNMVNSATSAPVQLRVKQVELYVGSQLLTNGTYNFTTNPAITVRSAFASGSTFYTLDGSAPTFSSTFYSGPFTLFSNATVRAIGYSADFSQSEEADSINAVVLAHHNLITYTPGGGSVTLNPPGGNYPSSTTVTATAVPTAGWKFLYWTGDASGTNVSLDFPMHTDYSINAVFGTTVSTTVQGNGQVAIYPAQAYYTYGQIVRVTGVPATGSYFGFWGNAATGNTNPLYFTVTNPNPTISSIFGTNSGSQVNIYVSVNGRGSVAVSPAANVYTAGQSITLTATPVAGASFVNWAGDASGMQNPLNVTLNQNKVITANFSTGTVLEVNPELGEGFKPEGFRFSLLSDPGAVFEIRSSSNLISWDSMGFVTNQTGELQLIDPSAPNSARKFYKHIP